MDRFEATIAFRDTGNTLPVTAVTAHAAHGDHQYFIDAGVNDYVFKPVNAKILKEAIKVYCDLP